IWSQDEASSVIYGMPKAVSKANLTERVLALNDIGPRLAREVTCRGCFKCPRRYYRFCRDHRRQFYRRRFDSFAPQWTRCAHCYRRNVGRGDVANTQTQFEARPADFALDFSSAQQSV